MFRKIIRWASIAFVSFIVLSIIVIPAPKDLKKNGELTGNAKLVAQQKARSVVKCSPATNKNCFTLTPEQLQRIKKMQNGLSRKKN
jgi:hypothetical protein